MNIRIVLALGQNREIGEKGHLPWQLPDDLAHFRTLTIGKPIIMGRETFTSLGKPLPKRLNIVLTRQTDFNFTGIMSAHSFPEALQKAAATGAEEVCVIGGSSVCALAFPFATHLSLTFVHGNFPAADTFFPEIPWAEWREIARTPHPADEQHAYAFDFVEYVRKLRIPN